MAWAGPATSSRTLEGLFKNRPKTEPGRAFAVGILSTYPSAQCGAATFAASLAGALVAGMPRMSVDVLGLLSNHSSASMPHDDSHEPPPGTVMNGREAAHELNKFDVVVIQHEQGVPDEEEAEELLDIMDRLLAPVVLAVLTVLSEPTAHQRYVLEMLTLSADAVVTTDQSAQRRLLDGYRVEPQRLMLIPHGAPPTAGIAPVDAAMPAHNATSCTRVSWPAVAGEYRRVFDAVTRRAPAPIQIGPFHGFV
ncbi:MAG TPA: hypothetical protein VFC19_42375 [Candidatus Limnocylindrales bacterium]|nr:hypothetical protein [Candidatus Limnocylindrales bacterium]